MMWLRVCSRLLFVVTSSQECCVADVLEGMLWVALHIREALPLLANVSLPQFKYYYYIGPDPLRDCSQEIPFLKRLNSSVGILMLRGHEIIRRIIALCCLMSACLLIWHGNILTDTQNNYWWKKIVDRCSCWWIVNTDYSILDERKVAHLPP